MSLRFLIWSYARVGQHHAAGHREGLDPRGDVHGVAGEPLGLDDHLADVDADADLNVLRRELPLHRDRGLHRRERAREHAHAAVAEPLHDRPAERVVLALERTHSTGRACRAPARSSAWMQRRVADHVGEHHGDEPTIEPQSHSRILNLLGLQTKTPDLRGFKSG